MHIPHTGKRIVGVVVSVGSLRSRESIGVGEFLDLIDLADLCAKVGIGLIQLLPVNDSGFQSSPYSALTAFGLHPLYLRLGELPEAAGFEAELAALGSKYEKMDRFPYGAILQGKLDLLRRMYLGHAASIAAQAETGGPLDAWIRENPWVMEYAVYRRLKDSYGGAHWKEWPAYASVVSADIRKLWDDRALREEHLFWAWLQRALDEQFGRAAAAVAERGLVLKGDLPILMNEDSCDVWAHGDYFRSDLAAGAPPDMFSPLGQNWQFPIYDWDALAKDDYLWWRRRLEAANRYYGAYRIDHVLGFFRIWAASRRDNSAVLGRFIPSLPIGGGELAQLGFDEGRLRWLSRPHVPTGELYDALRAAGLRDGDGPDSLGAQAGRAFSAALERISSEELWLFKDSIRGERDIQDLGLHPAATEYLQAAWRNRVLLEYEAGNYAPAWSFWDTRAFPTLSEDERRALEQLVAAKRRESEKLWEDQGRRLLSALRSATPMMACAEDLGAVPDCVPAVLQELGILGLRVVRWARRWGEAGEPYEALDAYPELTVCTPAVHDSSTVREWWEREADRNAFRAFLGEPELEDAYTPATALRMLKKISGARSRLCVFQLQDLLHLSPRWYAEKAESERINVPGTVNDFNWTYRIPGTPEELGADGALVAALAELCSVRGTQRKG